MTQFSRFSTGGYVLHRVTLDGTQGRFSAWFDKDGTLLDAEQFDRLNRTRPVQRDGPTWRALQRTGKRYQHAPPDHGRPVQRDADGHVILDNPARMKASIASFDDANRFYTSSPYPHKLGHNTHVFRIVDDGMRAAGIQYHKTFIVIYRDDGTIKLDSGGYRTVSTKSHMNSVLPPGIGVFQKKHDWFVSVRGTDVPFYDGMVIYGYADNPMRRPQKGDDLDAMGYPGHSLQEAQAIYDRAHRKTAEPDPRARMLAEQRRKPVGGTTMKDYRKAIREPLPGAHISGVTDRTRQLASAYPLDIWREGGPRWEGPFKIMGKGASRVFQVLATSDTVEEAIAAAPAFSAQHWADVEVWDKHDIAIAAMMRVPYGTPGRKHGESRMEYLGNPSTELDQFYGDIFVTAIEGGINYWASVNRYHIKNENDDDVLSPYKPGWYAEVYDAEDEGKQHVINRATIARAWGLINGSTEVKHLRDEYRQRLRKAYREKDAGDIDSGDADNIVQIGLFGEIVYG